MVMGAWSAIPVAALTLLTATNFQSRHKARQLHGSLQVAQAIGRIVTTQTDEDDAAAIGQRFLTLVQNLVPAQTARIWIIDSEKGVLTPCAILTAGRVSVGEQARLGEGIIGNAATHTHPRLIADAAQDLWKARDEDATGSWLLYPIRAKGHLMAVGQWVRPLGQVFTQEEIVRLDTIVPSVAMALENLHIRETMHVLASTDGLTGLWNHRRMKEILREEVRRSSRYHHPISILMMDVDSFKSFNDTYGHPQGDQLLKNVADVLTSVVRTTDFVGRYGGEEFIIVLPETAQHDACKLAERVRKAVETNAVVMIADQPVSRTLSIGVATFPEDALNAPDLVQRADEALYKAKRTGKNRVIWS
jgi:diguanylate cyclase (GGDEF)-like protein